MPSPPPAPPPGLPTWRAVGENAGWLLLEKGARWALGLAVGLWTARYLGPANFGLLNATLAWVALFAGAAGFGIEPIVVRELVRAPRERGALMGTALFMRLVGGLAAAGMSIAVLAAFDERSLEPGLVAIAALGSLLGFGETLDLWFQSRLQARTAALTRTVVYLVACAARVALILAAAPVAAFVWLFVVEVVLTSAALGVLFRLGQGGGGLSFSAPLARILLAESWPNMISNVASMGYMRADRVFLTMLVDETAAGIYSAAANLVEIWPAIAIALANSATPLLTTLYNSDPGRYRSELGRLVRLHAIIGCALAVGLAVSAHVAVPILLGPAFRESAPVLIALAASLPFTFVGVAAVPWYLNEKLTAVAMFRHVSGAGLNILLNFLWIPRWGAVGAAAATTVSFAVAHVLANGVDARTRPVFRLQLRALLLLPKPRLR